MARSQSTILDSFPYDRPRDVQRDLLLNIEKDWNSTDVFVIVAPTAAGKSAISRTISQFAGSYSIITPTNLLVNQYVAEFPTERTLRKLDTYHCPTHNQPCKQTNKQVGKYCSGMCAYSKDRAAATIGTHGIYNYYMYMAMRLYRELLIVDEAHNLLPTIQDLNGFKLWKHDWGWNSTKMQTYEDICNWLRSIPAHRHDDNTRLLLNDIQSDRPRFLIERTWEMWSRVKWAQGERPEEREMLRIRPIDIRDAKPILWPPGRVKKIVLMSATISSVDVEQLGLSRRRVKYYECASPIPYERRPILINPVATFHRESDVEQEVDSIVHTLFNDILPKHVGESGVIHTTYALSPHIEGAIRQSGQLGSRTLHTHTPMNSTRVYNEWRRAPKGGILIACGMHEGLDIVDDSGRWQVISKIPWPSLADPVVRYKCETDERWYMWETLKKLIQACGRICRTPNDWGVTYVLDSTFKRLYDSSGELMPQWWLDAIYTLNGDDDGE